MKLFDFLDKEYRNLTLDLQQEYNIVTSARSMAAQRLVSIYRTLLVWIHYPILLVVFILTKLKLKAELPDPIARFNQMQAQRIADAQAKAAQEQPPVSGAV